MTDPLWKRDEIESPCVNVCILHPSERLCVGCYRTGDEIARWSAMSAAERQRILKDLPARAPLLTKRRGGRSARRSKPD